MTLVSLLAFAAEESEHHGNVALETVIFGIIALAVFGLLALVLGRSVPPQHSASQGRTWAGCRDRAVSWPLGFVFGVLSCR